MATNLYTTPEIHAIPPLFTSVVDDALAIYDRA